MAIFCENDFERLDWRLLQNGSITLYWRVELLAADKNWFAKHGYLINEFDCSEWRDGKSFHDAFTKGLNFPDLYGRNLDALNDCLSDVEIPDDTGRLLVFQRFDCFATSIPEAASGVLDIIELNARRFLLFGRRLVTLIQSNDPGISFNLVGARPVTWNPREWLNKDRGL